MIRLRSLAAAAILVIASLPATAHAQGGLNPAAQDVIVRYQRIAALEVAALLTARGTRCELPDPDTVAAISAELTAVEMDADALATQPDVASRLLARKFSQSAHNLNWTLVNVYAATLPPYC